jgi:hypothetical protein
MPIHSEKASQIIQHLYRMIFLTASNVRIEKKFLNLIAVIPKI